MRKYEWVLYGEVRSLKRGLLEINRATHGQWRRQKTHGQQRSGSERGCYQRKCELWELIRAWAAVERSIHGRLDAVVRRRDSAGDLGRPRAGQWGRTTPAGRPAPIGPRGAAPPRRRPPGRPDPGAPPGPFPVHSPAYPAPRLPPAPQIIKLARLGRPRLPSLLPC